MASNWNLAIRTALNSANTTPEIKEIVSILHRYKADNLAGILNVEMKSMVRGSVACELLSDIFHINPANSDDERALWYVFATDAIIAAYNFVQIIDSSEFSNALSAKHRQSAVKIIDKILPNTKKAADAIRHHHNRAFGKSDGYSDISKPQFIAQWRCQIKVTDRKLEPFWYSFRPRRIDTMLKAFKYSLEKNHAGG